MKPKRRLVAIALDHQDQRYDDVADRKYGEIGGGNRGAVRIIAETAGRAAAQHLQEAAEQRPLAATRAKPTPAAPERGLEIDGIVGGGRHTPKMAATVSFVVATVCPESACCARPDDAG